MAEIPGWSSLKYIISTYIQEVEYYTNDKGQIGYISLDMIDRHYAAKILSADNGNHYSTLKSDIDFRDVFSARKWMKI